MAMPPIPWCRVSSIMPAQRSGGLARVDCVGAVHDAGFAVEHGQRLDPVGRARSLADDEDAVGPAADDHHAATAIAR